MKHSTLALLSLCLIAPSAYGQPLGRQVEVQPTGAYAEIDVKQTMAAMEKLLNGSPSEKKKVAEEIIDHSDRFAPPVFCALSSVLVAEGRKDDAMFWFYAGQLRTRFDINRCADKTVADTAGVLAQQYGEAINSYAFKEPAKLKAVIQQVINWDTKTSHNYDQRWINLHGLGAFGAGSQSSMSVDEKTWPDIAKSTREKYWSGFRLAVGDNPEDFFSDPTVVALARSAASGNIAKTDALIKGGADVNASGKDGASPLWFAYLAGNRTGFAHLLDLGADPTRMFKAMGGSVLESVIGRSDDDYLVLMLDHKLDPNAMDHSGSPIIHRVAGFGGFSKLRILVEHGANVNGTDKYGATPIAQASQLSQYDKVLYLLDHGADPAIQDENGCDVGVGLFLQQNLTPEADAKRQGVIAKLVARGYRFDDAAIGSARTILNLKEATGEEPPKWLMGVKGVNPAWLERHPPTRSGAPERAGKYRDERMS